MEQRITLRKKIKSILKEKQKETSLLSPSLQVFDLENTSIENLFHLINNFHFIPLFSSTVSS